VSLDYGLDTQRTADAGGHLQTVTVPFGGKTVPAKLRTYLMIDTSAVATGAVTTR
jgi:hypothetical protein